MVWPSGTIETALIFLSQDSIQEIQENLHLGKNPLYGIYFVHSGAAFGFM